MRIYTYHLRMGLLCLFFSFIAWGIQAQVNLNDVEVAAIEAGFDNDIFAAKKIEHKREKYSEWKNDIDAKEPESYSDFLNKGGVGVPPSRSLILHETKVETYNENRFPSAIPESFSGYKIEILHTMERVQEDNPIFFRHGRVAEEQLEDQSYAYLVGSFESEEEARAFLDKFISVNYPDAKVIQYKNGKRR